MLYLLARLHTAREYEDLLSESLLSLLFYKQYYSAGKNLAFFPSQPSTSTAFLPHHLGNRIILLEFSYHARTPAANTSTARVKMRFYDPVECNCAYTKKDVDDLKARIDQLEFAAGLKPTPLKPLIFPKFEEKKLKARQSPKIQIHSVHEVLRTPELLEAILLQLPTNDLLKCEQVSKGFQATMDGSLSIKKALFMAPPAEATSTTKSNQLPHINELLDHPGRNFRHAFVVRGLEFELEYGGLTVSTVESKPVVKLGISQYEWSGRQDDQAFPTKSSWGKMYLTQPPCDIVVHASRDNEVRHVKAMRFGDLLKMLTEEYHAEMDVEND